MNKSDLIIITFIVTALWDVVLRFMSMNFESLPSLIQTLMPFMNDLKPYFTQHTLLAAALIAGFVGATTQPIITQITPFINLSNTSPNKAKDIVIFLTVSFVISALYGFVMKASKLFPYLEKYYYEKLGLVRSLYHDGISGLIVQITILVLVYVFKIYFSFM